MIKVHFWVQFDKGGQEMIDFATNIGICHKPVSIINANIAISLRFIACLIARIWFIGHKNARSWIVERKRTPRTEVLS